MENSDRLKKDFIWNTLGSAVYALSSVVLSFVAMRLLGSEDGGIFAFGFSTFGQQMFIIAYFGIRPFHITDVRGEYAFSDYERARILTSFSAVLFALLYLSVFFATGKYSLLKTSGIFLLALYKIADGVADCYECECQRQGLLWRGGRELFLRTVLCAGGFLLLLVFTKDLMLAAACAVLFQLFCILFFRKRLSESEVLETGGAGEKSGQLLKNTALLFLGVFLDFYIFSSSKYAIDLRMSDTESGLFNLLFMPANVIYLAANFVIKPFMTRMAAAVETGDREGFGRMKKQITRIIAGLTAAGCLCAAVLGKPVLRLFELLLGETYTGLLSIRAGELVILIFAGGLYALASLYYYILVIFRKQKTIFTVYLVTAVLAAVLSLIFVGAWGITGAAVSCAVLMSVLVFLFAVQLTALW